MTYKNPQKFDLKIRLYNQEKSFGKGVYELMNAGVTAKTINEYGRFDTLADTVVREKAAEYFSSIEGKKLPPFRVNNKARSLLREFILAGGEDIPEAPGKKSD